MFYLALIAIVAALTSAALPDPLAAGWKGALVCESLHEDISQRVLRCTFAPGVGHERHYHAPNFGYAVAGGRMRITDASGTREVDLPTGSSFASPGTEWHEVLNVGETTVVYLIIEGAVTTKALSEEAVIALEDEWAAAEASRDEATLRRVLHDQFTYNSSNGETSGKEAMIANVLSSSITGQTITERTASVSGNTAMVFGTTVIQYDTPDGESAAPPLRYTAVYVKHDEQWRAIALQMTERTED
jgi:ketosteroid isomerase-like protein/quercetin dioxygenase-like cupin family protein